MGGPEAGDVRLETTDRLDEEQVAQVLRLVAEVTDADGSPPLSDAVLLQVRYGGDGRGRDVLVRDGGTLVGYARVAGSVGGSEAAGATVELALSPAARRGPASGALAAEIDRLAGKRLALWVHGERSAAADVAEELGLHGERVLHQLRRSLVEPLPEERWPVGVTVRTFVVGQDEPAWLAVNNRAFAGHPEQSGWTLDDIRLREQQPWFDPAGFFLAERDGALVGFHWTKVHAAEGHRTEPIGEVYVVGVDPAAQGQRLGPALTVHGLAHLRDSGLREAMLYVDGSNAAAITVYERLGFTHWDTDILFRRG